MKLNVWNIYLRNGIAYVPTVAQAESGGHLGYFMDIEPVIVVPATERETLKRAIIERMIKGNPIVPAPTRDGFPKPILPKYANVKSWSAFENNALLWTISKKDGDYNISPQRKRPDRGWEDDLERLESLPPGTTLDAAAERLATLVLQAL